MLVVRILGLLLTLALVAAAGGAIAGTGETQSAAGAGDKPRHRLADRLAAELGLGAAQVREALEAVRKERRAERAERRGERAERRQARADRRGKRAERRERRAERRGERAERRGKRAERRRLRGGRGGMRALRRFSSMRERLASDLAAKLQVEPAQVTAALRSLLAERLDRAVARGRLSADGRTAALACFDDTSKCQGLRPRMRRR